MLKLPKQIVVDKWNGHVGFCNSCSCNLVRLSLMNY